MFTWRLAELHVMARQRKSKGEGGDEISSECKDVRGEALGGSEGSALGCDWLLEKQESRLSTLICSRKL